jgi:AcrR family transcriptional regulator
MTSSRNVEEPAVEDRVLDAAARLVTTGQRRPGIAELARQAGVSRPTVYRYFTDGDAVFRALWEREIRRLVPDGRRRVHNRGQLVRLVVDLADRISSDAALTATFTDEPSLVARYILERLGTGQRLLLDLLTELIAEAQRGGTVRRGKPVEMAAMSLLIAQSAIQSRRMIADHLSGPAWRRELTHALNGYLA